MLISQEECRLDSGQVEGEGETRRLFEGEQAPSSATLVEEKFLT